jgi:hypothetical protein
VSPEGKIDTLSRRLRTVIHLKPSSFDQVLKEWAAKPGDLDGAVKEAKMLLISL